MVLLIMVLLIMVLLIMVLLCRKRGRAERETESRLSMDSNEIQSEESKPSLAGLFEVDKRLWEHIQHVQTNVKHLPSTKEQVEQVAK